MLANLEKNLMEVRTQLGRATSADDVLPKRVTMAPDKDRPSVKCWKHILSKPPKWEKGAVW